MSADTPPLIELAGSVSERPLLTADDVRAGSVLLTDGDFDAFARTPPTTTTTDSDLQRNERRLAEDLGSLGLPHELSPPFFKEVDYAVYPPVHERRLPIYGAMTPHPYALRFGPSAYQLHLPFPPPVELKLTWSKTSLLVGRQSADGYNSFMYVYDSEQDPMIVSVERRTDELFFSDIQSRWGISTLQRSGDGKVKLFLPDFIAVHENNRWTAKPYSSAMEWPLSLLEGRLATLTPLLRLAVHVLSPANVGATLVLSPRDELLASPFLDYTSATIVEDLLATEVSRFSMLRNIAAQNDRAVVVRPDGLVHAIGVNLLWDQDAISLSSQGGTRHNSALRASASEGDFVIIVVSSDGPVTIFAGGHAIATFTFGSHEQQCGLCMGSTRIGVLNSATEVPVSEDGDPVLLSDDGRLLVEARWRECPVCHGSGREWVVSPILQASGGGRSRPRRAMSVTSRRTRRPPPRAVVNTDARGRT